MEHESASQTVFSDTAISIGAVLNNRTRIPVLDSESEAFDPYQVGTSAGSNSK